MVLMAVGEDDAEQIVAPLLDEGEIGQDQLDARIIGIGEGQAEIDHHPFALAAVEIDVHADLARAAEREEEEFLAGFHRARPSRHSSESWNPSLCRDWPAAARFQLSLE